MQQVPNSCELPNLLFLPPKMKYINTCLSGQLKIDKTKVLMESGSLMKVESIAECSPEGFTLTLQETRSIHDSMNIPKIEFIAYIYILL